MLCIRVAGVCSLFALAALVLIGCGTEDLEPEETDNEKPNGENSSGSGSNDNGVTNGGVIHIGSGNVSGGEFAICTGSGGCTGCAELDILLEKAKVADAARLTDGGSVYTWDGFCAAARAMAASGRPLFMGTGENAVAQAASNIASLLAQCAWESGGEAPWTACDENNYKGTSTAACTQRDDGQRYDTLTSPPACTVDKNMAMTAETYASWTPGPLKCEPGTDTAGCCWWGRGAIQTTGPHNYKKLQIVVDELKGNADSPELADVDLCSNPEAMCQKPTMKWMGAIEYWTRVVQNADEFEESLCKFVASGFDDSDSFVGGASFNDGTGGVVNNGFWSYMPHGSAGRSRYFTTIMTALKAAGMNGGNGSSSCSSKSGFSTAVGNSNCKCNAPNNCYVASWAEPCMQTANEEACLATSGATWCDDGDITNGSSHVGRSCEGKCSSPNNCYVASWAVPCMQSADEGACLATSGAEWCGESGSPSGSSRSSSGDDCEGKCSSPYNCYVDTWAEPCMQSADKGACLATIGAKWCGDVSISSGGVAAAPPTPLAPISLTAPIGSSISEGCMTMWSDDNDVIVGSHCGYAAPSQGGVAAAAAQGAYIQGLPRKYCAIHNDHFNGGEACGKCFKLKYDGKGFGTCSSTQANPAPNAGEAVIQVVDSGSGNHDFDCVISTFEAITGHNTDRFPVNYEEVECETATCDQNSPDCIMTVASGSEKPQIANYYLGYARVTFHNLKTSVKSVEAEVGQCDKQTMNRNGAMFDVSFTNPSCHKPVKFTATLSNLDVITVDATDWPAFSGMRYCHEPEVTWTQMTCDKSLR